MSQNKNSLRGILGRLHKSVTLLKLFYKFMSSKTRKLIQIVHEASLRRIHRYLNDKLIWYRHWFEWKHHKLINGCFGGITLVGASVLIALSSQFAHASGSSWVQSDWSGGVGSSTTNQYVSETNSTTSTANQVTLALGANEFTNPSLSSTASLDSFLGVSPTSIGGLVQWVDGSNGVYTDLGTTQATNGQTVEEWTDMSGQGNTYSQLTGSKRPTLETNTLNGWPVLHHTAANSDFLVSPLDLVGDNFTVMYVASQTGPTRGRVLSANINNWLLGWWSGAYNQAYFNGWVTTSGSPAASTTNAYEFTGTFDGSIADIYDDGSQFATSTNSGFTGPNDLETDGYNGSGEFSDANVAEIIAYNNVISSTNRQALDNYLDNKYALAGRTVATSSSVQYNGNNTTQVIAGTNSAQITQAVTTGNTNPNILTVDAYTGPTTPITSSYAQLYANGSVLSTTYTALSGGWYQLQATVNGSNSSANYGVEVMSGQTVYLSSISLATYPTSGTVISNIYNTGVEENWGNLTYSATVPSNTTVSVLVRSGNQANLSDAPAFTSCSAISSGNSIVSSCAPTRTQYVQYELQFTSNGSATPTFSSVTIPYTASDTTPPQTNASVITAENGNGGATVASDGWANTDPYFSWTAATDHAGGSGIGGYCIYLGQSSSGNPITSSGDLSTSSPLNTGGACPFAISSTSLDTSLAGYLTTALTSSTSPYYLNIAAITNADVVWTGSVAQFEFLFDNTPPTNPSFITAPSEFVSSDTVTLTWSTTGATAAADAISGVAGLQYRIGSSGTWYGVDHSGAQNCTDLLENNGSYTMDPTYDFPNLNQGDNIIYFRTWNNACVVSAAYVTTVIKINSTSPSAPQNLTATPSTNTTNSFAFSWLAPATYVGSASNLTYCYTINVLPTVNNCSFTATGVTSIPSGSYATEPGSNTIYVVAKDEAGNINYATASNVTFTANTPAPGIPLNLDIADVSIKSSSSWKLALSWNTPSTIGAGISSYKIMRSTDRSSYTNIASTAGTSYVDSDLSQQTYYYQVEACDSANNCGALTTAVSDFPTGKFTSPANLISGPDVTETTRTATINWTTDRTSDSSVEYGLTSGVYYPTLAANTGQVTSHSLTIDNLQAGTTYYYRSLWTDLDGNTGTSAEYIFTTLPAPTVSNVSVSNINLYNATITFTSNYATAIQLQYGGGVLGSTQNLNTSTSSSSYSIPLSGLTPGTTYSFKLNPYDTSNNIYDSPASYSFTTPPQPVISNVEFSPIPGALTGTEQISWTTNVPSSSQISYGLLGGSTQEQLDSTLTTDHTMTMSDLNYNTQYSVTATSVDSLGNVANSDLQVFKSGIDTRPPIVSEVTIQPSIVGNGASAKGQLIVSWKTDKAGTSQVAYGNGTAGDYTTTTAQNAQLVNNHVVVISGLATSEVYHVEVISNDADGIKGTSTDQTTIIGQSSDNALSIVFNSLQNIFGL